MPCNPTHHEMMLSTDLCLGFQFNKLHADCMVKNKRNVGKCNNLQRKGVFLNAKTDTCCAWTSPHVLMHAHKGKAVLERLNNDYCGINAGRGELRGVCCMHEPADSVGDCDAFNWPKGPAFDHILHWARQE